MILCTGMILHLLTFLEIEWSSMILHFYFFIFSFDDELPPSLSMVVHPSAHCWNLLSVARGSNKGGQ
jgi:hypothetical protein